MYKKTDCLKKISLHKHIFAGYSGGLDSGVLLRVISKGLCKDFVLKVIHINHRYNSNGSVWFNFCRIICNSYKLPLYDFALRSTYISNFEAEFRYARLNIFSSIIDKNKTLFLAQHKDDALETLFLNLFRGSSLSGLIGLRVEHKLCQLNVIRPFLNVTKKDLFKYAITTDMCFIFDESNLDNRFSRNYFRNLIYPVISRRWNLYGFSSKNRLFISNILGYFKLFFDYFCETYGFNYRSLSVCYLHHISSFIRVELLKWWLDFYNYKPLYYKHIISIFKSFINLRVVTYSFYIKKCMIFKNKHYIYLCDNNLYDINASTFFFMYYSMLLKKYIFFKIIF